MTAQKSRKAEPLGMPLPRGCPGEESIWPEKQWNCLQMEFVEKGEQNGARHHA
jgi:hypothetical protein